MTNSYLIKFDSGIERETSITFFVQMALKDPEARVFDAETGEEITDFDPAPEAVA